MPKIVFLWTDMAIWALFVALALYIVSVRRQPNLAANWAKVFRSGPALASAVLLAVCLLITLADSIHYRKVLPPAAGSTAGKVEYDTRVQSVLDTVLARLIETREATYSRPLSTVSFTKESVEVNGQVSRVAPRLKFGGAHLSDPDTQWAADVTTRGLTGAVMGLGLAALLCLVLTFWMGRAHQQGIKAMWAAIWRQETKVPWHVAYITLMAVGVVAGAIGGLMSHYHVFGTDITGNDVLLQTLKSIRTAFVIGALSTLATLPLAVVLGIMAGYYKGWVDELIQYVYTVLSSIPNILLIAACVLMVQVFLDKHPELFETGVERADLKLFLLCAVLGLTGWAGLCRLLRGETLKLRELDYVQAANAFGVTNTRIMVRHIFPNVAHLMLIVTVLEFSALILYEAVLALVGVGVDSSTSSFGGMINLARNEMSRDPSLTQAFTGCRFAPRCEQAQGQCQQDIPELWIQGTSGRAVRCWLHAPQPLPAKVAAAAPAAVPAAASTSSQTGAPLLQVQNLSVKFPIKKGLLHRTVGHFNAVDGVTFDVPQGRTLALVGESGCGKTTSGKAIVQLLRGQADIGGQALLGGRNLFDMDGAELLAARRQIQIIFQDPFASLNPRMRVAEVLEEGMAALLPDVDAAGRRQRIEQLADQVGLRLDALDRYPHEFSGGQRQRIAIARALAVNPKLIVCDEPTSALDVSVQAQILNLLRDLQSELGVSYLFITHNIGVVEYIADEVAVMRMGKVVEQGPCDRVLGAPQDDYTRKLIASVPRLVAQG
ncbi:MAG: hypothetical protein C4K60_18895 [Ideonella sp. MAG2]|nr:MAG: hypothetical protein C4K60_18895 [Ideonella sp. MAG2]